MEIRDARNGEWHWVYNALVADPHISSTDKVVYAALSTFAGYQEIRPSVETIAKRCNLSERATRNSLRRLEEVGYLGIAEKSGGRGRTNVYEMLKMIKGCKLCPLYKGGKEEHERGQTTTEKGANYAPHKDIDINKGNISIGDSSPNGPTHEKKEVEDFIRLFAGMNPAWKKLLVRKAERGAAGRLLDMHPHAWWAEWLAKYRLAVNADKFCPRAFTPWKLEEKMADIQAYITQKKSAGLTDKKAKVAFI